MESTLRKCLNEREKSFGNVSCPGWLIEILPHRIQSIDKPREEEEDEDEDDESSSRPPVDLHPYQLIDRIPLLPSPSTLDKVSSTFADEYPHDESFLDQHFIHLLQLTSSPSRAQLSELLEEQRSISAKKRISSLEQSTTKRTKSRLCEESGCVGRSIPLTRFCGRHLLGGDEKQILFDHCLQCDQLSFRGDNTSRLHFCSHHLHLEK